MSTVLSALSAAWPFIPPVLTVAAAWGLSGALKAILYPRYQTSSVANFLPWTEIMSDQKTVRCTNKIVFRVISLEGIVYSGLKQSVINDLSARRYRWLLDIASNNVKVRFFTDHTQAEQPTAHLGEGVVGDLNSRWNDILKQTYSTRHHIVLSTTLANIGALDKVFVGLSQLLPEARPEELLNKSDYDEHSPLLAFLTQLLNGVPSFLAPQWHDLAEALSFSHYEPRPDGILRLSVGGVDRFYRAIAVKNYDSPEIQKSVYDALLSIDASYQVCIYCSPRAPVASEHRAAYSAKQAKIRVDNPLISEEWEDLKIEINAGKETLIETQIYIFPFAENIDELSVATRNILEVLAIKQLSPVVDEVLAHRAFVSRLPGLEYFSRPRDLTAAPIAELTPFSSAPHGNRRSAWGPSPIRYMPTAGEQAPYGLTYHASEGDDASPHDIIIAGTRSGKTVFDTFREMGAMTAHPELRALKFDRNQGLRIYTAFMEGQYLWPDAKEMPLNIFDCEDTAENRQLQEKMLEAMADRHDTEALRQIQNAVADTNESPRHLRNLRAVWENYIPAGPLKNDLEKWVKSERSGSVFTGEKDAFDPNFTRLITVALDTVADDPRLAGVLTLYFLKRIQTAYVGQGLPYSVTVDEASTLLQEPSIAELILSEVRTAAKNQGQVTTIWQDFRSLTENSIGRSLISNAGTLYIWPGTAENEEQLNQLSPFTFSETEKDFALAEWSPPRARRPVLVKREHESVFLETDLSPLGSYLKIFAGGVGPNMRLLQCQKEFPKHWRQRFLDS